MGRVDRVAAFGAAVALAGGFALPFVEFRPNRIASGVSQGISAAGLFGWLLIGACAVALASSLARPGTARRAGVLLGGAAAIGLLAWALGAAAVTLRRDADPVSRVSIGAGAWLVLVGATVVWYAGQRGRPPLVLRGLAALLAFGGLMGAAALGGVRELSLAQEYAVQSARFWQLTRQHVALAGTGVGLGTLLGVPLGAVAARNRFARGVILPVAGVIETVPSLALLGLLVLPLASAGLPGIGAVPAVIALTLYALLPIVRNTYVGLEGVDSSTLDAGRGMGMSRLQLLLKVEAPLALPLVLEGVRAAATLVVGITAVTAFVGAGGLGVLVFLGWGQQADDLTLLGALPMVALAVLADLGVRLLARATVSPGIAEEVGA